MSNVYAATPQNAMRSDALAGVRTRRIIAVCIDLFLVSLLVAALWILSIFLTFGLALFFLPPLYPFVAFFYNGLTVSGAQNGDAGHAGDGSRNAHARHRRAGPVRQCGRTGGAVLCKLVLSADPAGVAGRWGKAMSA